MSIFFAAELKKLRLAPDFISEEQANQILRFVNGYVAAETGAHLIDVLWRQHAQRGEIILNPQSHGCINRTGRRQTLPYVLTADITGAWAPAYREGHPLLFRNLKHTATATVVDDLSVHEFDRARLDVYPATDMLFVVPLTVENVVCGLFSIEWDRSFELSRQFRTMIDAAADTCAMVCWKSEITALTHGQTAEAINIFIDAITETGERHELDPARTGFFARPYEDRFGLLESIINRHLATRGVAAHSFSPVPGRGLVVPDILRAIERAHFGLVDITGQSANVMLELGAIMGANKQFVVIRDEEDRSDLPFDAAPYQCNYYRWDGDAVYVLASNNTAPEPIGCFLDRFIGEIESSSRAFREANRTS
jgi:hypothetical protein